MSDISSDNVHCPDLLDTRLSEAGSVMPSGRMVFFLINVTSSDKEQFYLINPFPLPED
jgi:hypothetical protein